MNSVGKKSKFNMRQVNNLRWAGVQGPTRKRTNPNEEIHNRDLNINEQLNLDGDLYLEPGKSISVHAR